ncbi:MAG: histidinol-phosphate transaminase [Cyanobacteria bacterium P01_F01_bin.150]
MSSFLRSDLAQLVAYTPQPGHGGDSDQANQNLLIDHLDTNESPFDLSAELKQKLAWHYQQELETNRYPDGGHGKLKEAIALYANESANLTNSLITPEWISVGNGSDELIRSILIATCLNGNGSILVANPTFSMYGILARTLGVPVITVDRHPETFAIDCAAAQSAIVNSRNNQSQSSTPPIRVVFVVHPNSPTANALTEAECQWLRTLPDDILVVIDEAYYEFSQTSLIDELSQHPNWVITRTFSKAFRLAAHRVGYSVAQPAISAAFEKIRLPYNLPSFSQVAALTALRHRQALLETIDEILAERDRLSQSLEKIVALHIFPSQANFIFAHLNNDGQNSQHSDNTAAKIDLSDIVTTLRSQGTLIRHTGGGLRITVGTSDENQRTVRRLITALS